MDRFPAAASVSDTRRTGDSTRTLIERSRVKNPRSEKRTEIRRAEKNGEAEIVRMSSMDKLGGTADKRIGPWL
jgi:hypothetical protein